MPIVNLKKRITTDQEKYNNHMKSSDSLIFVQGQYAIDQSGTDCLALSVGDCWYENGRYIKIPDEGVKVKARSSIVFMTQEKIATPLNVYGLIFGAGTNIYTGGFLSTGKIDPGYVGRLKIGYYNGSSKSIVLKRGERLGYCLFFTSEHEIKTHPIIDSGEQPRIIKLSKLERVKRFVNNNISVIISAVSAVMAVVSAAAAILSLII